MKRRACADLPPRFRFCSGVATWLTALALGLQVATAHAAPKPKPERRRAPTAQTAPKPKPERRRAPTARSAAKPRRDPRQVDVQVVEMAGGRAYLSPGGKQQVRVGDQVRIGGRRYPVLAQNQNNIVIALGDRQLVRGQRGVVMVRVVEEKSFATRGVPRPLQAFAARWRAPRMPADSQTPKFVPLGVMSDARRNRAAFVVDYQRIQPLSGPAFGIGRSRLRALLHAELSTLPLSFDADGFAELWHAQDLDQRPENASRPILNVRQLELGYRGEAVQGAVGRLRYASRTLGTLDGARVSAALGQQWSLGAFGGTLANPRDGSPDTEASRFGTELAWQNDNAPSRPRASLTLQGSRFLGRTDERRVTGVVESYPDFGRLGARAEVAFFDADNPWAAAPTELSAAGADASVKLGSLRLGAAFDMRRPERSLWLASFLPRGYFCVEGAVPGAMTAEPCVGSVQRYLAALNAAWEATSWTLDAGTTLTTTRAAEAEQATAFLSFRKREVIGKLRFDAGASASSASLLESVAFNLGSGSPFWDDMADLSLYYRPSLLRYRAGRQGVIEHGVGTRLWWAASTELDLSGSAELVTGGDVDVLMLHVGAAYRPRF